MSTALITLKQLNMLSEIETQGNILSIWQRCSNFVKVQWRKKALKIKDHDGTYPKFDDLSSFMSSISLNVNDPVYGSDNYYEKTKSSTGKLICKMASW